MWVCSIPQVTKAPLPFVPCQSHPGLSGQRSGHSHGRWKLPGLLCKSSPLALAALWFLRLLISSPGEPRAVGASRAGLWERSALPRAVPSREKPSQRALEPPESRRAGGCHSAVTVTCSRWLPPMDGAQHLFLPQAIYLFPDGLHCGGAPQALFPQKYLEYLQPAGAGSYLPSL